MDKQFNETVLQVAEGKIKEINYESAIEESSGGALSKSVSVPKAIDDTEYK